MCDKLFERICGQERIDCGVPKHSVTPRIAASIREGAMHRDTPIKTCGQKCIDLLDVSIPPQNVRPSWAC